MLGGLACEYGLGSKCQGHGRFDRNWLTVPRSNFQRTVVRADGLKHGPEGTELGPLVLKDRVEGLDPERLCHVAEPVAAQVHAHCCGNGRPTGKK